MSDVHVHVHVYNEEGIGCALARLAEMLRISRQQLAAAVAAATPTQGE